MNKIRTQYTQLLIFILSIGFVNPASAVLYDRGNGLIYDSDQNLTWLQDTNFAYTSGYAAANAVDNPGAFDNISSNGRMGWDAAMAWANGLTYQGYSDWRLPALNDIGNDGCNFSYSGTDCGYNVDTSGSELAYMWYVNLGNTAYYDTSGNLTCLTSFPCLPLTTADAVEILNLQNYGYWTSTESTVLGTTNYAFIFGALRGLQDDYYKANQFYAWAVREGDVATISVSEPDIILLLLVGVISVSISRKQLLW